MQELLMDVRDKLLFEPEYAGNVREKIPPKSSLQIPWPWLPAALCLLQEVNYLTYHMFFYEFLFESQSDGMIKLNSRLEKRSWCWILAGQLSKIQMLSHIFMICFYLWH